MNVPLWAKLLALAGVVCGIWVHGRHAGSSSVQADWDASELKRERATLAQEASQRRQAYTAAERYEAQRSMLQANATQARVELLQALQRPICQPGEANAPQLADLAVPAAAVQRLRDAAGPRNPD